MEQNKKKRELLSLIDKYRLVREKEIVSYSHENGRSSQYVSKVKKLKCVSSLLTFPEFHFETEAKVHFHQRASNKGAKSLNRCFQC